MLRLERRVGGFVRDLRWVVTRELGVLELYGGDEETERSREIRERERRERDWFYGGVWAGGLRFGGGECRRRRENRTGEKD